MTEANRAGARRTGEQAAGDQAAAEQARNEQAAGGQAAELTAQAGGTRIRFTLPGRAPLAQTPEIPTTEGVRSP